MEKVDVWTIHSRKLILVTDAGLPPLIASESDDYLECGGWVEAQEHAGLQAQALGYRVQTHSIRDDSDSGVGSEPEDEDRSYSVCTGCGQQFVDCVCDLQDVDYSEERELDAIEEREERKWCKACNGHGMIDDSTSCDECDGTGIDILYW